MLLSSSWPDVSDETMDYDGGIEGGGERKKTQTCLSLFCVYDMDSFTVIK